MITCGKDLDQKYPNTNNYWKKPRRYCSSFLGFAVWGLVDARGHVPSLQGGVSGAKVKSVQIKCGAVSSILLWFRQHFCRVNPSYFTFLSCMKCKTSPHSVNIRMQFWQVTDHKAHTDTALHCDVWRILNMAGDWWHVFWLFWRMSFVLVKYLWIVGQYR